MNPPFAMFVFNTLKIFLACAVLAGALMTAAAAHAETLLFSVRSEHPNIVSLEFYSENREHSWPGGNEVYILDDSATHTYNLRCNRGEKICMGAWVRGRTEEYWGVGRNARQSCTACCFICDGSATRTQVLNP